nr:NosD domain-containing protein [Candidatus Sigynarchaeota archaeon]
MKKTSILHFAIIFSAFASIIAGSSAIGIQQQFTVTSITTSQMVIHRTISIRGDVALDAFCAGNGTDGLTPATAHVIDYFNVTTHNAGTILFQLNDTTRHVIVRNCFFSYEPVSGDDYYYSGIGIVVYNCANVTIDLCTGTLLEYGFVISHCTNVTISSNYPEDCDTSVYVQDCGMINVHNNTIQYTGDALRLIRCNNATLYSNVLTDNSYGIHLQECTGTNITSNDFDGNSDGINAQNTALISIRSNTFNGTYDAIYLNNVSASNITDNYMHHNYDAISMDSCNSIKVVNNSIDGDVIAGYPQDRRGIFAISSTHCEFTDNTVASGRGSGILLGDCIDFSIDGNTMYDAGILLQGTTLTHFNSHEITPTNRIGTNPIIYFSNRSGLIPANFTAAGQIILANVTGSEIDTAIMARGTIGVSLYQSHNNIVHAVTALDNLWYGMYLWHSDYNNISACDCSGNRVYGILLNASNYNDVHHNRVHSNGQNSATQIVEVSCTGNTIHDNDVYPTLLMDILPITLIFAVLIGIVIAIKVHEVRQEKKKAKAIVKASVFVQEHEHMLPTSIPQATPPPVNMQVLASVSQDPGEYAKVAAIQPRIASGGSFSLRPLGGESKGFTLVIRYYHDVVTTMTLTGLTFAGNIDIKHSVQEGFINTNNLRVSVEREPDSFVLDSTGKKIAEYKFTIMDENRVLLDGQGIDAKFMVILPGGREEESIIHLNQVMGGA